MEQISAGWQIGQVLTKDTIIIWVVDIAGQIWFAIEELVLNGRPMGIPKHQECPLHAGADKLGHPALVGCASARIGGEILFDDTVQTSFWEMNNKSRRYGLHPSRRDFHLTNAARQFAIFGITLKPYFITPLST
ncbi:MAG: hypothetical protein ACREC0_15510 [Methylocella sp.]